MTTLFVATNEFMTGSEMGCKLLEFGSTEQGVELAVVEVDEGASGTGLGAPPVNQMQSKIIFKTIVTTIIPFGIGALGVVVLGFPSASAGFFVDWLNAFTKSVVLVVLMPRN